MKKEDFIEALRDIYWKTTDGGGKTYELKTLLIRTNIPSVSKKNSKHNDGNNLVCFYPSWHETKLIMSQYIDNDSVYAPKPNSPDSVKISIKGGKEDYYVPIESITYLYVIYK